LIRQRVNDVRRAEEQLCLLDTGLLPQSEGAVAAARSAYGVGTGSITALLDSQMSFLNFHLQRSRLLAEREINLAELTYLVGCPPAEGVASGS
jgi:outer membrane protein TolC